MENQRCVQYQGVCVVPHKVHEINERKIKLRKKKRYISYNPLILTKNLKKT